MTTDITALKIRDVMTALPITVDEDTDLPTARRILREQKIRHLPVLHDGKITGILSERDTRLAALVPALKRIGVADVMSKRPLTVAEDTPVTEVVARMAAKKYGSAIVTDRRGIVTGIFTTQDALTLLMRETARANPALSDWPRRDSADDVDPGDEDDCL